MVTQQIRDVARAIQKFSKIESECLMEMAREYKDGFHNYFCIRIVK